ncbi:uncharacterized protein ACR2FA_011866 [Aphomia sociella]
MKLLLVYTVFLLSQFTESRIASSETDLEIDQKEFNAPCIFRTLQGGDPYPSVVVKWQGQVQRLTWNSDRSIRLDSNYKQPSVTHSYPAGGLSGGKQTAVSDPFGDAPVVPETYTVEEIKEWFGKHCIVPY